MKAFATIFAIGTLLSVTLASPINEINFEETALYTSEIDAQVDSHIDARQIPGLPPVPIPVKPADVVPSLQTVLKRVTAILAICRQSPNLPEQYLNYFYLQFLFRARSALGRRLPSPACSPNHRPPHPWYSPARRRRQLLSRRHRRPAVVHPGPGHHRYLDPHQPSRRNEPRTAEAGSGHRQPDPEPGSPHR